ncbi:PepSY-associated TM helix domain-containing protein [Rhodopseudomonas palustris]|uniref:PepSY domain-containing protein n=1 Tax=Rhodopseudomonas palustris TaxID=1076 RepID=A0AAX3DZ00_RHOPL|nr:PepSY-associated TM helix domain-containing protein [Rhodopseudomonas palustris]AVT78960.1 peptidase [Rhodopseudomonas palustris]UYO39820.1 PepSY domain-containing protein [Rhodopseudomonas palustris]
MNNALLLKLHRWTSLVFALPLLAIIVTGLILSVEPMLQGRGLPAGTLDAARLTGLIERYDPQGQARGLAINATGQQMRLLGVNAPPIDLATGEAAAASDSTGDLLLWARRTHERLLGYEWLVIASTIAMTVLMTIGVLMGLPRLRNSLAGWHKGAAWFTLPLLLLSPLTALCMAFGLTLSSGPPPARMTIGLTDAVQQIAQSHDVSHLAMIANRGGRMMARIYEDGELRAYTFAPDGVTPLPRNWPRLLHEGNWSTWLSGTLNVITSVVLLGLLVTGVWLWTRRKLRRRPQRPATQPA